MREPVLMIDADLVEAEEVAPSKKSDRLRFAARKFLNKPGFHTSGHVIAEVESPKPRAPGSLMSGGDMYPGGDGSPRVRMLLADCTKSVSYDFSMHDEESIDNSLHKARTLAEVFAKFAEALEEEAKEQKARIKEREKAKKAAIAAQAASPEMATPINRMMRD